MFSNILKWAFKIGEKELHLLLDSDTSLEAVKEVAYQIIKHCANIEDQQKAQKAAEDAQKAAEEPKEEVKDEGQEQAQAESSQAPQE